MLLLRLKSLHNLFYFTFNVSSIEPFTRMKLCMKLREFQNSGNHSELSKWMTSNLYLRTGISWTWPVEPLDLVCRALAFCSGGGALPMLHHDQGLLQRESFPCTVLQPGRRESVRDGQSLVILAPRWKMLLTPALGGPDPPVRSLQVTSWTSMECKWNQWNFVLSL